MRDFKKKFDVKAGKLKRRARNVSLRKDQRAKQLIKRRCGTGTAGSAAGSTSAAPLSSSPFMMGSPSPATTDFSQLESLLEQLKAFVASAVQSSPSSIPASPALHTLRCLLCDEQCPVAPLLEHGLLPLLSQLITVPHPANQLEAVWCLTNIASSDNTQHSQAVMATAPALIGILTQTPSQNAGHSRSASDAAMLKLQKQAAWTLSNLAADSCEARVLLMQGGVLPALIQLLHACSEEGYYNAANGSGVSVQDRVSSATVIAWSLSNVIKGQKCPTPQLLQAGVIKSILSHLSLQTLQTLTLTLTLTLDSSSSSPPSSSPSPSSSSELTLSRLELVGELMWIMSYLTAQDEHTVIQVLTNNCDRNSNNNNSSSIQGSNDHGSNKTSNSGSDGSTHVAVDVDAVRRSLVLPPLIMLLSQASRALASLSAQAESKDSGGANSAPSFNFSSSRSDDTSNNNQTSSSSHGPARGPGKTVQDQFHSQIISVLIPVVRVICNLTSCHPSITTALLAHQDTLPSLILCLGISTPVPPSVSASASASASASTSTSTSTSPSFHRSHRGSLPRFHRGLRKEALMSLSNVASCGDAFVDLLIQANIRPLQQQQQCPESSPVLQYNRSKFNGGAVGDFVYCLSQVLVDSAYDIQQECAFLLHNIARSTTPIALTPASLPTLAPSIASSAAPLHPSPSPTSASPSDAKYNQANHSTEKLALVIEASASSPAALSAAAALSSSFSSSLTLRDHRVVDVFLSMLTAGDPAIVDLALRFVQLVLRHYAGGVQLVEELDGIFALESLSTDIQQGCPGLYDHAMFLVDEFWGEEAYDGGDATHTAHNAYGGAGNAFAADGAFRHPDNTQPSFNFDFHAPSAPASSSQSSPSLRMQQLQQQQQQQQQ